MTERRGLRPARVGCYGRDMVPDPSAPLELAFIGLVLVVAAAVVWLVHRADGPTGRCAAGISLYLLATWAAGASGVLGDELAPRPQLLLGPALVCTLWFALRSAAGSALALRAPLAGLVALQAFRLPLELVMHAWSEEGALPVQMTFAGFNFDIVTGALALVIAPFAGRARRALVLVWNILGLLLLANIVTIALLSLPGAGVFPGIPNVLVLRPPYTWLPAFLVQVALGGHILVFRALRREGQVRRDMSAGTA